MGTSALEWNIRIDLRELIYVIDDACNPRTKMGRWDFTSVPGLFKVLSSVRCES